MAARGLWIEMIALMHEAVPYGHLFVSGHSPTDAQLAVLAGAPPDQVPDLLGELESAGVFSRTKEGVIYSRKMTRTAKKAAIARKNGKNGGNPSLRNQSEITASDNQTPTKEDKPQKPDTRSQIVIEPIAQRITASEPREPMLLDKLIAAAGLRLSELAPTSKLLKIGPIVDLVSRGYAVDGDVLPVVRDLAASGQMFQTWSYVVPIVVERTAKRNAIPAKPVATSDDWAGRVQVWRESGTWGAWGPRPGEPGCRVPPEYLQANAA